jgi:hypothetical protein
VTCKTALHAALLSALLAVPAAAQVRDATGASAPLVASSGAISGVVVSTETPSTPVRRAIVTATSGALNSARSVVSDDNGAFTFERLPPGEYAIAPATAAHPNVQITINDAACPKLQTVLQFDYTSCQRSLDADNDSVPNLMDDCPVTADDQTDSNSDGVGDACE